MLVAAEHNLSISWPLAEGPTDGDLYKLCIQQNPAASRKIPDMEYLHKELVKQAKLLDLIYIAHSLLQNYVTDHQKCHKNK